MLCFLQFAQGPSGSLPLAALALAASRHFSAELEVSTAAAPTTAHGPTLVTLRTTRFGDASFTLTPRPATDPDYARLDAAERQNQSSGMADLGRRCPGVWEVAPLADSGPAICYYFGAVLASVALGPLLPNDESGLYGIRSARLKADKLNAAAESG